MYITRLKPLILSAIMALLFTFGLPAAVLAATPSYSQSDACDGLSQLDPSQDCGQKAANNVVANIASTIVQILSVIIGIAAVIMIIIAGFRFVTSNGDSNSVASAKTSLIYALVGLVIASLAEFLVHFVLVNIK